MRLNIARTASLFFLLFPATAVYLSYWQFFASDRLLNNSRNRRLALNEKRVLRGSIFDRNGERLTWSEFARDDAGRLLGQERKYYEAQDFCHLLGYLSDRFGRTGVERLWNSQLSGMTRVQSWDDLRDLLLDDERRGHDVFLTVDSRAQTAAVEGLNGRKGAVVALVPSTGEILAMVSVPGFDPSTVDARWEELTTDPQKPLINRATSGLYPPGSTFKVVTAGDALEEGLVQPTTRFVCRGHVNLQGYDVSCPDGKAHGPLDLTRALVVSCNVTYSQVAVKIGKERFQRYAERWGVGEELIQDLEGRRSSISRRPGNMGTTLLAQSGFGQGEIVVTPLEMAVVAATIANGGLRMRPFLVRRVSSYGGEVLQEYPPTEVMQVLSRDTAALLGKMMESVVKTGSTRRTFAELPFAVAGKSGSAQNPHGQSHAWFIACAPVEQPRIAVACIVENAGAGSKEAAPIVKKVIEAALLE